MYCFVNFLIVLIALFFIVMLLYRTVITHVKTIQYNAMHKFVRVLDNPFVNLLFNFFIIQWNPKNSIGLIGTAKICSFKIFRCGHTQ